MGYYGYFDPTYLLVIIGAVICMIASARVKTTFNKYAQIRSYRGMTGAQVAQQILRSEGISDVAIRHVSGSLTDHYDPSSRSVNLSDPVCNSSSISAIAVAAHECGHAIQHARGYVPLSLRSAFVPVANFGSTIAWPLILIGLLIQSRSSLLLIEIGILCFSFAVLFQLITLPVEFNASARALRKLEELGILGEEEHGRARRVLTAAALTYVAGAASSILQLLRILLLTGGRRRD